MSTLYWMSSGKGPDIPFGYTTLVLRPSGSRKDKCCWRSLKRSTFAESTVYRSHRKRATTETVRKRKRIGISRGILIADSGRTIPLETTLPGAHSITMPRCTNSRNPIVGNRPVSNTPPPHDNRKAPSGNFPRARETRLLPSSCPLPGGMLSTGKQVEGSSLPDGYRSRSPALCCLKNSQPHAIFTCSARSETGLASNPDPKHTGGGGGLAL